MGPPFLVVLLRDGLQHGRAHAWATRSRVAHERSAQPSCHDRQHTAEYLIAATEVGPQAQILSPHTVRKTLSQASIDDFSQGCP